MKRDDIDNTVDNGQILRDISRHMGKYAEDITGYSIFPHSWWSTHIDLSGELMLMRHLVTPASAVAHTIGNELNNTPV